MCGGSSTRFVEQRAGYGSDVHRVAGSSRCCESRLCIFRSDNVANLVHQRVRGMFAFVLIFAATDVGAAQVLKRILSAWNFEARGVLERKYRIASPLYHHDFFRAPTRRACGETFHIIQAQTVWDFATLRCESFPSRRAATTTAARGFLTEGVGVAFDSTFAGILASQWRKEGVEVLNAGVAGYSPAMYYRKAKYLLNGKGLHVDGILVLIDISDTSGTKLANTA